MSDKKENYVFPSRFGSHASMVDKEATNKLIPYESDNVVLKDEFGFYTTLKNRLDTGLADPNRYTDIDWDQEHRKHPLCECELCKREFS